MNMLQMIFRDSQGRVRWGYKFFTLILIVELLLPVFLIFASGVGLAAFMPFLASKGIIDAQGMVTAPYQEAEAMSQVFGRFYTWSEATGGTAASEGGIIRGICPEGWHIPSDDEWTDLAEATMASVYADSWRAGLEEGETGLEYGQDWSRDNYKISKEFMAGERLDPDLPDSDDDYDSDINYGKEARSATFNTDTELWPYLSDVGDPTNWSGISAIPAGYARKTNGQWSYSGAFEYAIFWTSTEDPATGKAICRVINNESSVVYRDAHDKETFAASVRCVKD